MTTFPKCEIQPRPVGRDAVRAAVIAAAAALFSEHGIAAVSVREVASHAGVNHGLVHRHFGSKEQLVRDVMDSLAAQHAEGMRDDMSLQELYAQQQLRMMDSPYFRLLAHALLEGREPGELQGGFPVVRKLVAAVVSAQRSGEIGRGHDARLVVAVAVAAGLGWMLFEPYLLTAAGLPRRSAKRLRAQAFSLCAGLAASALRANGPVPTSRGRKGKES